MEIIPLSTTDSQAVLARTQAVLAAGGLVIFPTETTYGAGVDATNPQAVEKLLAYKSRREGKPLSIAVSNLEMAQAYLEINEQARQLAAQFLPGPVTIVCQGKGTVAPGVESEFGTLGIRIPDYQLILDLVAQYGKPITSTSANGSGEKRPYSIQDIFDGLSEKQKSLIDLVLDAGQLPPNPPSTVIDTTLSTPVTLRAGEISLPQADTTTLISRNEQETKDLAKRLLLKHWNEVKETGLVLGLDGALGTGKTIFTKGVAEFLQITETVTSPTYTYIQEYEYERHGVSGTLYHLDLWKVETEAELERLELKTLLQPNSVVVIEWVNQVWPWLEKLIKDKEMPFLHLLLEETEHQRQITLHE